MRRASLVVSFVVAACLGTGCASIYVCEERPGSGATALIEAKASVHGYGLAIGEVGRDDTGAVGLCSPSTFVILDDATFVEVPQGAYLMSAKLFRAPGPRHPDFWIRGVSTVRKNHCYTPKMVCDGEVYDEPFCHLDLEETACRSTWWRRRVQPRSYQDC
jgi:hypothetical protein